LGVRRLITFALADDTGENREHIFPSVVPVGVRIGALIEQRCCYLERMCVAAGYPRVSEIEERLPIERSPFSRAGGWIGGEASFDFCEVSRHHCGVQAVGADLGPLRQNPPRGNPIATPRR
jgi:hypothetical protein